MPAPAAAVQSAFQASVSLINQRVEIFEADAITRWKNGAYDDRLIGGSITVDYSRDERRAFDITLDNGDHGLKYAPTEFWYNKILKAFSGILYWNGSSWTTWETQVGEFMIDKINESNFPYQIKASGRDYTKKCQLSKFVNATAFTKNTPIENAIKSMAQNAGCTKFLIPVTGSSLGKDYYFERGVARWDAMKQIAEAFGYELFFDAQGYLVMREFLDPLQAPLSATLQTGPSVGNLASYDKSINDTRLYNHIVVTGESSDSTILPVMAEAKNTEPSSPTNIDSIGDRVYQYTSSFITTTQQAQDVANKFLKIHALEEFDLNFNAIAMPWLEVGEIIEFIDPRPSAGQPTRFLLSSINVPLDLGPMSGNAKRVSVVG